MTWMMLQKNFTLVPYIGETGSLGLALQTSNRRSQNEPSANIPAMALSWQMSSQVKYGRDGAAYALHQLWRKPTTTFAKAADKIKRTNSYAISPTYIEPALVVRKDLRFLNDTAHTARIRKQGSFVTELEQALVITPAQSARDVATANQLMAGNGVDIADGSPDFEKAAHDMNRAWAHAMSVEAVAQKLIAEFLSREESPKIETGSTGRRIRKRDKSG